MLTKRTMLNGWPNYSNKMLENGLFPGQKLLLPNYEQEKSYNQVKVNEVKTDSLLVEEACLKKVFPIRQENKVKSLNKPQKIFFISSEIENPPENSALINCFESRLLLLSIIKSSVNGEHRRTWKLFSNFGLDIILPNSLTIKPLEDQKMEVIEEVFKINYKEGFDWGCLQLRCLSDNLIYGKEIFRRNELLTLFFYKGFDDLGNYPFPPILTLTKLGDQNYLPILPNQIFQLILPYNEKLEDYQTKVDKCLKYRGSYKVKKNNLVSHQFECFAVPQSNQLFYSQKGSLIVPNFKESDVIFVVTEPYKKVKILAENVKRFILRFAKEIPIIKVDPHFFKIEYVRPKNNELMIELLRSVYCICIESIKGSCFLTCHLYNIGIVSKKNEKTQTS